MNSKKGISLIVLVITIIVIIILAAAVILSLNNNNVLTNSRRAVNESDFSEVQSAWAIALSSVTVKQLDSVVLSGEITEDGFAGRGYAGEEPAEAQTASSISTYTQDKAMAINIDALGLPSSFTNVAINNNKVVAIVKNGQLMYKDANNMLTVMNANFTGTINSESSPVDVQNLIRSSSAWKLGAELVGSNP